MVMPPVAENYSALMPTAPATAHEELRATVVEYAKVCEFLERYEALVERGKKRKKELEESVLPEIMEVKCLQSSASYPDGLKVVIKTDYYANIPSQSHIDKLKDADEAQRLQERLDEAMDWIKQNAPDVIKRKFEIMFSADEEDQKLADKFERDLAQRKRPLPVCRSATVHPQTLNALVRQLIDDGHQLPREKLGVYEKKVAKITLPR